MTAPFAVRSARHRLVPEIGDAGVARLAASRARPQGSPLAVDVARRFLERAEVDVAPQPIEVEEPAVVAYLRGSILALDHVTATLGVRQTPLEADALFQVIAP